MRRIKGIPCSLRKVRESAAPGIGVEERRRTPSILLVDYSIRYFVQANTGWTVFKGRGDSRYLLKSEGKIWYQWFRIDCLKSSPARHGV